MFTSKPSFSCPTLRTDRRLSRSIISIKMVLFNKTTPTHITIRHLTCCTNMFIIILITKKPKCHQNFISVVGVFFSPFCFLWNFPIRFVRARMQNLLSAQDERLNIPNCYNFVWKVFNKTEKYVKNHITINKETGLQVKKLEQNEHTLNRKFKNIKNKKKIKYLGGIEKEEDERN